MISFNYPVEFKKNPLLCLSMLIWFVKGQFGDLSSYWEYGLFHRTFAVSIYCELANEPVETVKRHNRLLDNH